MKFKKLAFTNWRCFLGKHEVVFAEGERNVTVLVGQNGSGKTALLNAFAWVLFEETTVGFRRPEDLFNHAALADIGRGEQDCMEVELTFEHDGATYVVRRYQDASRSESDGEISLGPVIFSATRQQRATEVVHQENINAILPPGLHHFFFFPAENIGKDIAQEDTANMRWSMSNAIDVLLQIEYYDQAAEVLSHALDKHLRVPRTAGDAELLAAQKESDSARTNWKQKSDKKKSLPAEIKKAEDLAAKLELQLQESESNREAKEKYNSLKKEQKQVAEDVERHKAEQRHILDVDCAILFGHEVFSDAADVLEKARKNGEIPPKISAGLLQELLTERKQCICGNNLGDEERTKLEDLQSKTLGDQVAEVASDLFGRIDNLAWVEGESDEDERHRRDVASAELLLEHVAGAVRAEKLHNDYHQQLHDLLQDSPEGAYADADETRVAWQSSVRKLERLKSDLNSIISELPHLEKIKNDTERTYQSLLRKSDKATSVAVARGLLSNVENTVNQISEKVRSAARADVERAMNGFFSELLFKNYRISLTDDFHYDVVDDDTEQLVGVSSSEVALATFAFVGALASLIPVYANITQLVPREDEGAAHTLGDIEPDRARAYPVVLDAPYSPFGSTYATRFSKKLPDLLPQSIVIIREDQLEHVEPMLRDARVGKAYVIQLHTAKEKTRQFSWQDQEFDYIINNDDGARAHSQLAPLPVR